MDYIPLGVLPIPPSSTFSTDFSNLEQHHFTLCSLSSFIPQSNISIRLLCVEHSLVKVGIMEGELQTKSHDIKLSIRHLSPEFLQPPLQQRFSHGHFFHLWLFPFEIHRDPADFSFKFLPITSSLSGYETLTQKSCYL